MGIKGYFPRDSPYNESDLSNNMAEEGVSWQVNYQGKPCYVAYCETEVLIISQDDTLPVADAVPRLTCELTDDDKKQLERLELPQSSWNDDAAIMKARHALDKRVTMIRVVERGKSGEWLRKTQIQQLIRNIMKTSTKPACKYINQSNTTFNKHALVSVKIACAYMYMQLRAVYLKLILYKS